MVFANFSGSRYIIDPDIEDSGSYELTSPLRGGGWVETFKGNVQSWMAGKLFDYYQDPSKIGSDYRRIKGTVDKIGSRVNQAKQGFRSNSPSTRLSAKRGSGNSVGDTTGGGYPSNGGGGGTTSSNSKSSYGNEGYGGAGTIADKTVITFNAGIPSGLFNNPKEKPSTEFSSLYVMGGTLIPNYASNHLKENLVQQLIKEDVYWDYLTRAEKMINRIIQPHFSDVEFLKWLLEVCQGLQLYYQIDAIMAYDSEFDNKNPGMAYLREKKINSKVIDGHLRLKKVLERQAVPPNLLNFIRYMMQNFTFGECSSCPIYRLGLNDSLFDYGNTSAAYIDGSHHNLVISLINSSNQINSYMVRAFPDWVIKSMPASTSSVILDKQFRTFWFNASTTYMDVGLEVKYSHTVKDHDTTTKYGMFTDNVDGLYYSLSSLWDESVGASGQLQTGLWDPWRPNSEVSINNRVNVAAHTVAGMTGLAGTYRTVQSGIGKVFTYSAGDSGFIQDGHTPVDVQYAQVHSINNMKMALSESTRFLFNPKGME